MGTVPFSLAELLSELSPFSHLPRTLLRKQLQNINVDSSFSPFIIHRMDPTRLEAGFRFSSVNTNETLDQTFNFTGPPTRRVNF